MGNGFIATGCDLEHSRLTLAVLLSGGLLGVGPAMRERSLVKSAGRGDFCAASSVSRPAVEVWRCRASGVGQCPLSLSKKNECRVRASANDIARTDACAIHQSSSFASLSDRYAMPPAARIPALPNVLKDYFIGGVFRNASLLFSCQTRPGDRARPARQRVRRPLGSRGGGRRSRKNDCL